MVWFNIQSNWNWMLVVIVATIKQLSQKPVGNIIK